MLGPETTATPKYVIRARLDKEGKLHQEQFRIAYHNKELLYLIVPGSKELTILPRWMVHDDIPVALIMEQFNPASRVYYWNPIPRGYVDSLETSFRAVALSAAVSKAQTGLANARSDLDLAKERLRSAEEKNDAINEIYLHEHSVWTNRLRMDQFAINKQIADGKPVKSVFVHPDNPQYDSFLKTVDRKEATVLNVKAPDNPETYGYTLECRIVFEDVRPGIQATVHGYTLPSLYAYLTKRM